MTVAIHLARAGPHGAAETSKGRAHLIPDRVAQLAALHPEYLPLYTDHGCWKHGKETWTNWCEGFPSGQMWLFHELGLGGNWQGQR